MSKTKYRPKIIALTGIILIFLTGIWIGQRGHNPKQEEKIVIYKASASPKPHDEASQILKSKTNISELALTPELAKSKKEEFFSKTDDLTKRAIFSCELMHELCLGGYSEAAFQLLDSNYGVVRTNEIATLFKFADLPDSELLKRFDEISVYAGDKERALDGYLGRFKLDELVESTSQLEFQAMLSKGMKIAPSTLSGTLATTLQLIPVGSDKGIIGGSPQFLKTAKELIDKGFLEPADFVAIANQASSVDAFERWDQIQKVVPIGTLTSITLNSFGNAGQSLISEMVMSNGPKTLHNLLKVGDNQSVNLAISQWTHSDPSGATQWYTNNAGQLSSIEKNSVSSAFSSTALDSSEFDTARVWAKKVQDPKSKEDLLNSIAKKEAKMLADRAAREKKQEETK